MLALLVSCCSLVGATMCRQMFVFVLLVTTLLNKECVNDKSVSVEIKNNGPVFLDEPITFYAKLENVTEHLVSENMPYTYHYEDNLKPKKSKSFENSTDSCNFTTTYLSDLYKSGSYQMKVIVKELNSTVAQNTTTFKLIDDSVSVQLTSDSPALLDAPITFFAKLVHTTKHTVPISYVLHFEDNLKPKKKKTIENCTGYCNFTTSYLSSSYERGSYKMKVIVKKLGQEMAQNSTVFKLKDNIPGSIVIVQEGNKDNPVKNSLILKKPVHIQADLHDPEHFFKNGTLFYRWHINDIITAVQPEFNYTFVKVGTQYILVDIFAEIDSTDSPGFSLVKSGSFSRKVKVSEPVKIAINGSTVLKYGRVCHINVTCSGSPPFRYCWKIFHPNETVPKKFVCTGPVVTTICQFPVIRYLSKSGSYIFVVQISNDVSTQTSQQEISILDETEEGQLTTIIIPVVCSVFAIAIIVWGIGYFVHTRNRLKIEVADFDFQIRSNDLAYRTFFGRLRDSFAEVMGCCGSEQSNLISGSVNYAGSYGSVDAISQSTSAASSAERPVAS